MARRYAFTLQLRDPSWAWLDRFATWLHMERAGRQAVLAALAAGVASCCLTWIALGACGYGRTPPDLAAADGTVVASVADQEDRGDLLQREGESDAAYEARSMAAQNEMLAQGPSAVAGNYVVLHHPDGEFGFYGHLRQGSLEVEVGDRVERGQLLGQVGMSGNTTEPHLHFHLTDGEDFLYARGLPVRFSGASGVFHPDASRPQSGYMLEAPARK